MAAADNPDTEQNSEQVTEGDHAEDHAGDTQAKYWGVHKNAFVMERTSKEQAG
jgi:hypothetical protein